MLTDTYHPLFDGIVRYFDYLIPQLLARGHEVTVVCPWFKGASPREQPEERLTIVRAFNTRKRTNAYYWSFPNFRTLRAIQRADIVVVHSLMPLGLFGGLLAKAFGKKIGFFVHHDERVILHKIARVPSWVAALLFTIMREVVNKRLVDVFFHATERFKRKLLVFSAPEEKIRHTPFAINTKRFQPEPAIDLRARYNIPSDAVVACYVGRLSTEKNIENILTALDQAMAHCPNLFGLIVGGGADWEHYSSLPREHKERFIFTGFVPEKELPSHFAVSDLFVTPTHNESSCFTVFEAMASRLPVITSAKDHDPDIVHREHALLVRNVSNPNEIAQHILLLATNPSLRQQIASNGEELIKSRTWADHATRFLTGLRKTFSVEPPKSSFPSIKRERPSQKEHPWDKVKAFFKKTGS